MESTKSNAIKKNFKYDKQYLCAVCNRACKTKWSIKQHILRKHSIIYESVASNLKKPCLPTQWSYSICNFNNEMMKLKLNDIKDKEEMKKWVNVFMKLNCSQYVIRSVSKRSNQSCNVIQLLYYCEHFRNANRPRTRKKKVKGTGCSCKLFCAVTPDFANVKIQNFSHNHLLTSAAVLSSHKPSNKVKIKTLQNKNFKLQKKQ